MGTAKQDTRKLNIQPNTMPATVSIAAVMEGEEMGVITVAQGPKLSAAGNVTYMGGIKKGWMLDGEPVETLATLAFEVNGVRLTVSQTGVHSSKEGNPTVGHIGFLELAVAGGEPRKYQAQIYATYVVKKGAYCLTVKVFPAPTVVAGPAIAPGTTLSGAFLIAA